VFSGSTVLEVCGNHLHTSPDAPGARIGVDLPAGLDALVVACLAKDPGRRPDDARALGLALTNLGLPAWTEEDAANWWREHRSDLETFQTHRRQKLTLPENAMARTEVARYA